MNTADHIIDQIDTCLGDYAVSDDAMRCAPDLPPLVGERLIAISIDTTSFDAAFEHIRRMREGLAAYAEAVRPRLEEIGRTFAAMKGAARHAGLIDDHGKPAPRRDRPAWQSPYGPPRRR